MSEFVLVELEPMPGRRIELGGEVTIGRQECDLTISSPQVSRRHASVTASTGGTEIVDHGSRNGTFVNDSRVAGSQGLAAGDKIRIGENVWELVALDTAAPTELEPRGDVPAPAPAELSAAVPPPATPRPAAAPAMEALEGGGSPRVSAARRMEATLICYAVVVLTAIAVVIYLATR